MDRDNTGSSEASPTATERLEALQQYDILDTPPEEAFDRITRLASDLFDVPMSLVSLVADDRQWFKSSVGFDRRETGLNESFCVHALASEAVTVIGDATEDERVADNPLVTGPAGLRFYAGAPLVTPDGVRVGTLCVLDTEPRSFPDARYDQLQDLAAMVVDELELRREITARAAAEEELERQKERYRSAISHSPILFARVDADLRYEWIYNPHVDFDPQTVLGKRDDELDDGPGIDALMDLKRRALEQNEYQREEITFERSEGPVTYDVTATPCHDPGEPPAIITAALDVTQRKTAEKALRQSRERWQRLVENQPDAVQITVGGEIRYVNAAGADLLGADAPDDLVGRSIWDFLPSDEVKADMRERVDAIRRGEPTSPYEHEVERLDGERRIVETYSIPINYEGERAAQSVVRDLTERRRTQRQLQQAQKMETVGALAGGIAHDFNNILHAVTAYVDMVQQGLGADDPNRELLRRASGGLERASDLVQKLLTFSRQERTQQFERVDLGSIVGESIDLVSPSLPAGIDVRTRIDDGCITQGDPGQLHQAIMNVLTNAGQAMSDESSDTHVLDVDVRLIDVDADLARRHLNLEPGRYARLSISDTGPGMADDVQARIFEPFFTTKEVGAGTGLGLSVVHGIVQAHDGEIAVYSEPGEGTTFDLYVPYATEEVAGPQEAPPSPVTDPHSGHILVVDDDAQIIELEAVRLRRLGYEVTTCETGAEALKTFDAATASFAAVVTDYAMPGMNGLALTRELRDRQYGRPVLLLSGFSAQVSPEDMRDAGVTAFLRKPVGGDELKSTLGRLLDADGGS